MAPPGHVDMQHTALSSSSCSHMPVIARASTDTPQSTLGILASTADWLPAPITHHYTCSARRSVLDTTLHDSHIALIL